MKLYDDLSKKKNKCKLCGGYINDKVCLEKKSYTLKHKSKKYCFACEVELFDYEYHYHTKPRGQDLEIIKTQRMKELDFLAIEQESDKMEAVL
jgi:hypothetical protein